jgi:hypothetical protein
MRLSSSTRSIFLAVGLTFGFTIALTLFLGVSQFGSELRSAFEHRLDVAAENITASLVDETRVGVTIHSSDALDALLKAQRESDPVIATVAVLSPQGTAIALVGDASSESREPKLRIERPVVSDFGLTLASVRVVASGAVVAQRERAMLVALLIPALLIGAAGVFVTAIGISLILGRIEAREAAKRQTYRRQIEEKLDEVERVFEASLVKFQ